MRSTLLWVAVLTLMFGITKLDAQDRCGTMGNLPSGANPAAVKPILANRIAAENNNNSLLPPVYSIPVVFHVIHGGTPIGTGLNVDESLICATLDQLNKDFNAQANRVLAGDIQAKFAGDVANAEIRFVLANVDPQGNPTNGIIRWAFGAGPFSPAQIDANIKPCTIWNPNNYMNIWSTDITMGILGYAQFPPSYGAFDPNTDGVVTLASALGSEDCPAAVGPPYNLGRTLTHEVGHYLGLFHIWGDDGGACGGAGDGIADTPDSGNSFFGCPGGGAGPLPNVGDACNACIMYMNFMDYTDDACMFMFTNDQVAVMRNILTTDRVGLITGTRAIDFCIDPAAAVDFKTVDAITDGCGLNENGSIIANVLSSTGCLEFSLDGGPYQADNIFDNVTAGMHTVAVRASKETGCTYSTMVQVMNRSQAETDPPVAPTPTPMVGCGAAPVLSVEPSDMDPTYTPCQDCPFDPASMTMSVNIQGTHTYAGDLGYYLQGPNGVTIPLAAFHTPCYGTDQNFDITFTNGTGITYIAALTSISGDGGAITGTYNQGYGEPIDFCAFEGVNVFDVTTGWTILVEDCYSGDTGTITNYNVTITGGCADGACAVGTASAAIPDGVGTPGGGGQDNFSWDTSCGTPATVGFTFGPKVLWYAAASGGTPIAMTDTYDDGMTFAMGDVGTNTYYASFVCGACESPRIAVPYDFNCPVVPVELVNFDGKAVAQTVELDWATASELNNSHFEVERSLDGNKFVQLGKVAGNGTTVTPQAYSFTDLAPKTGLNYYRLKQVDFDGTHEYSNVVVVEFGTEKVPTEVFPSPAADFLTVKAGTAINSIKVYDITGKVVLATQLEEATLTQLNVSELLAGTYFVNIVLTNGDKDILRFVKN